MFRADEAIESLIAERRVEIATLQERFSDRQIARMFYPDLSARLERGEDLQVPPIDDATLTRLYDMYDGSIHFVDAQIGLLLRALETLGLEDDTLIALTADHGQALGQHDWLEHGNIRSEVVHVPLILNLPGTGIEQPRRIDRIVSIVDLMPTLVSRLEHPAFEVFLEPGQRDRPVCGRGTARLGLFPPHHPATGMGAGSHGRDRDREVALLRFGRGRRQTLRSRGRPRRIGERDR